MSTEMIVVLMVVQLGLLGVQIHSSLEKYKGTMYCVIGKFLVIPILYILALVYLGV